VEGEGENREREGERGERGEKIFTCNFHPCIEADKRKHASAWPKKERKKAINPFVAAWFHYYLGKLFVAIAQIPIEGISDGTKTTSPNGEVGRPKLNRTA
jgi:hypothetical protein